MRRQTHSSAPNSPVKTQVSAEAFSAHDGSQTLKLIILPKHAPLAARFLILKHPTDCLKKRFYFCPRNGLFELKKVNAPTSDLRSILYTGPNENSVTDIGKLRNVVSLKNDEGLCREPQQPTRAVNVASGYVTRAVELFVATPFDMVFILIPLLNSHGILTKSHTGISLLQSIDDILDPYLEDDKHLQYILQNGRSTLEIAAARICDVVEAGGEKMFRLNREMLFKTILDKAQNAVKRGLPSSLQDAFVKRPLEKPILSVKREESSLSTETDPPSVDGFGSSFSTGDSQSTTVTSASSAGESAVSSTTTIVGNDDEAIPDEVINLQQVRTAWSFITSSCLPNQLAGSLTRILSSEQSPVDFGPLERYLGHLATLRAEALALRTFSELGQKRGLDDEDASEARAEKKRKQEEAEKRKKTGESRGIRELKKVDVSGMKKMSAFFTKTSTTKVKS